MERQAEVAHLVIFVDLVPNNYALPLARNMDIGIAKNQKLIMANH
jgi:hypothetical protein